MEQGVREAEQPAGTPSLTSALSLLEAAVEAVSAIEWSEYDADEMVDAVSRVEVVARRLDSVGCAATAELAAGGRVWWA